MKVLISDYAEVLFECAQEEKNYLNQVRPDWEIEIYPYEGDKMELGKKIQTADAILTGFLEVDSMLLPNMERLKCISVNAVGFNTIDLETAKQANVMVCALKDYCTVEVAEHTMALLFALSRKLKAYENLVEREGKWTYQLEQMPRQIAGGKIGIFGYGAIGRAVAKRAHALGMEVWVYQDKHHALAEEENIRTASLDEIMENCTVISNHMSQTKENTNFFNRQVFEKMKQKPIFLNTGRGDAVDEEALLWALEEGILYAAGLDVLRSESLSECKLLHRDDVMITPHAAFYSSESMHKLITNSCDNIIHCIEHDYEKITRIV